MDNDTTMRAVADILAATVLLDQEARDAEMIEFCHSIMTINQRLRPGVILPRRTILSWFESRKADIQQGLMSDQDDQYKISLLEKITEPELRRKVLAAIFAISVCDNELHDDETGFIQIALRCWQSEMPSLEVLDLIAG